MPVITVQDLDGQQVEELLSWRYDPPYDIYNLPPDDLEQSLRFYLDPGNGYFAITGVDGEFLGFCNFGLDARVPGGDYEQEALDVGIGMRPDLTGKGEGGQYARAVFDFARQRFAPVALRVTIAAFNVRAQRLCRGFGFRQVSRFNRPKDGRPFVIMLLDSG